MRTIIAFVLIGLALVDSGRADVSTTNQPFPGITCYSETRKEPPTRMFVAEIDLANPKVRLQVSPGGPDPDGSGPWQTTLMEPTKVAARDGFELVVNGDFFRARGVKDAEGTNSTYRSELWSAVTGPAVSDGKVWSTSGSNRPCLVVRKDGKAVIKVLRKPEPEDWEVVSGNTMFVRNGAIVPHENKVRHPRTVVGLNADGTKLTILVVDGRRPGVAVGMNYDELAAEMIRLGCQDALNLDGGGSSVMAVRDPAKGDFRILNQPTDGRERAVANVLGVSIQEQTAAAGASPSP
jgi:exopolysaccharide biosynthesis protein